MKARSIAVSLEEEVSGFSLIEPEELMDWQARPEVAEGLVVLEAHFSSLDHPLDPEMPVFRHLPGAI